MHNIMIAGAGTIGRAIAEWLHYSSDYQVTLVDAQAHTLAAQCNYRSEVLDVTDEKALTTFLSNNTQDAIISSLPFFCNTGLAQIAKNHQLHYFDLTEDVHASAAIEAIAKDAHTAFAPQCGLAPGFIDIIAHQLIQQFDVVDSVQLRCGALPQYANNGLGYAFTWSPDGLINEYINDCTILRDKKVTQVPALADVETLDIDGSCYEAFNTSGGLATLAQSYENTICSMNYKTLRYPGHAEKMHFLLHDLKLKDDRDTLKTILLNAIPFTKKDVVVVHVKVIGQKNQQYCEQSFTHKYYPTIAFGQPNTAIQLTTVAGLLSVVDIVLSQPQKYSGFISQDQFSLEMVFNNRFGQVLNPNNSRKTHDQQQPITNTNS